jgi:hypothetical protein
MSRSAATATAVPEGADPVAAAGRAVKWPESGRYQPGAPSEIARVEKPWLEATAEMNLVLGGDRTHQEPAAAAGIKSPVRVRPMTASAPAARRRAPLTRY